MALGKMCVVLVHNSVKYFKKLVPNLNFVWLLIINVNVGWDILERFFFCIPPGKIYLRESRDKDILYVSVKFWNISCENFPITDIAQNHSKYMKNRHGHAKNHSKINKNNRNINLIVLF